MFYYKSKKKNNSKSDGFTLIETLISITLFAFVVTITLTAILTILDINKKSRSLMAVMNNLNFAVDSITLSFKTGKEPDQDGNDCFETNQVNYKITETAKDVTRVQPVEYCITENGITKKQGNGDPVAITSEGVEFNTTDSYFKVQGKTPGSAQPILFMHLVGTVKSSSKVQSTFRIQTSVSQRDLNFDDPLIP
jgi:prepilin-type N-terminal cleavage/methylation domain-containing protein